LRCHAALPGVHNRRLCGLPGGVTAGGTVVIVRAVQAQQMFRPISDLPVSNGTFRLPGGNRRLPNGEQVNRLAV
jgi:hypothetical protein